MFFKIVNNYSLRIYLRDSLEEIVLKTTDGWYLSEDVSDILKEKCKTRGDKSQFVNDAIREKYYKEYNIDKPLEIPKNKKPKTHEVEV